MNLKNIRRIIIKNLLIAMIAVTALPFQVFASPSSLVSPNTVEGFYETSTSTTPMVSCGYEVNKDTLFMTNFPKQYGTATCSEYKIGSTFYTYNSKGTSKTTGGNLLYVKIGSKYKYVAGAQCLAYARYIQEKLYGVNDGTNSGKFKSVGSLSASKMNASRLKSLIQKGGRGAHLRTGGRHHSFIILKTTDSYFTVVDANGTAGAAKIGKKSFTYEEYAKGGWGKRGIDFLNVRK